MKDKFTLGLLGGFAGTVVMGSLYLLFEQIPGVSLKMLLGVSRLFVPTSMASSSPGIITGYIGNALCGSLLGLGIMLVLEKTGYGYIWLKGVLLGLMIWFLTCGVISTQIGIGTESRFIDNIILIVIHIAHAVTTTWFIQRFRYRLGGQAIER